MLRRTMKLWWAMLTLAVAAVSMMVAPSTASADIAYTACPAIYPRPAYCDGPVTSIPLAGVSHIGWVYLNLNYCPPGAMCALMYRQSMSAWSWSGTAWKQSSLSQGWVYVYPYTGAWRWAWTQSGGWVAVNSGRFEIRSY